MKRYRAKDYFRSLTIIRTNVIDSILRGKVTQLEGDEIIETLLDPFIWDNEDVDKVQLQLVCDLASIIWPNEAKALRILYA